MLDKEPIIEQEESILLIQQLSELYPQLYLKPPLSESNFITLIPGMNSYEFKFASYLYHNGFTVFREPEIFSCSHVPDFFIYSPFDFSGKLVELTLYDRNYTNCNSHNRPRNEVKKTIQRKREQIYELEQCQIPYVVLYREELEQIRKNFIPNLF